MFVHHTFAWYVSPSLDPYIFAYTMAVLQLHVNTFVWSTNQDRFLQTPSFGHSYSLPSCKAHNQFYIGPPSYLSYRCFGTTLYLAAGSRNLVLANHVVPYQLNLRLVHRFCLWSLLTSSSTFPSLGRFISLDLMLLLNMIESPINLSSGNHLGGRKVCVGFSKNLMLSPLWQLRYVLLCYVFDLWITSLLTPNLVTTFACYPSFV
jgi:hypothetical protein